MVQVFFGCQAFLSCVVFIATLLLYIILLQNRLYFVAIAKQLNAIRGYLMATEASDFHGNQLYTTTDFPALKPSSVHTFQIIGAALLSSLFAGISSYSLTPVMGASPSIGYATLTFFVILIAEVGGGIKYLASSDGLSADEVIHGKKDHENQSTGD